MHLKSKLINFLFSVLLVFNLLALAFKEIFLLTKYKINLLYCFSSRIHLFDNPIVLYNKFKDISHNSFAKSWGVFPIITNCTSTGH